MFVNNILHNEMFPKVDISSQYNWVSNDALYINIDIIITNILKNV